MKYIYLITLIFDFIANGQVTVTSDVTHSYNGYMNFFQF
jgi:hypothetical protein